MAGVKLPKVKSPAQMKAEMAVGRARDVLPKAEREINLGNMLRESAIKERLYHGTTENIEEFKPRTGDAVFLTPDPKFANKFALNDMLYTDSSPNDGFINPSANVMPVYVQAKNPFDYENPKHIRSVLSNLDPKDQKIFKKSAPEGSWKIIENYIGTIEDTGFDSVYLKEMGRKNLAVFDPSKIKSAIGNQGTYDTTNPDITKAHGGAVKMGKGGLPPVKAPKVSAPKVESPTVMKRSDVSDLFRLINEREGLYGAKRVERAADEIPNLEKLYTLDALRSAFSGDNARALMTLKPADFEKYAAPLLTNLSQQSNDNIANLKAIQNVGGFSDVPFFLVNKELAGSTGLPWITGHEGRHRNRAMDEAGVQAGLVQFLPRAELREPFPRRSQDQYIDAIRKEMALSGNKVKPEKYYLNENDEKSFQRPTIDLPDLYADGGAVKMKDGGDPDQEFYDRMREEFSVYNKPTYGNEIPGTPTIDQQRYELSRQGQREAQNRARTTRDSLTAIDPSGTLGIVDALKTVGKAVVAPIAYVGGNAFDWLQTGKVDPAKSKARGERLESWMQPKTEEGGEILETISKVGPALTGSEMGFGMHPNLWASGIGLTTPKQTAAGLRLGAERVAPFAKDVGEMASEMYMRGDVPGMVSPSSYVIKPKGGNWLEGGIDAGIDPLRSTRIAGQTPAERIPLHEALLNDPSLNADQLERVQYQLNVAKGEASVDKWIDTKLKKYVQNELATPEDPIRALAAKGVSHMIDEALEASSRWVPEDLGAKRRAAGFPEENMADLTFTGERGSPAEEASKRAAGWETIADTSIYNAPASRWLDKKNQVGFAAVIKDNPFLEKASPETRFNTVSESSTFATDLGFDHLVDELKNATRIDSDLPEKLRIDPSKLEKMTVPQVVERVSEINKWRAENQAAANQKLAMNPATQVFKEYPDQGYKWVELAMPKITVDTPLPEGFRWLEPKDGLERLEGPSILDPERTRRYLGNTKEEALVAAQERSMLGAEQQKMLEDALKYEGDTMGHCVGGYCPDLLEGRSRIYSLRDSKGQPHVTIEVSPNEIKSWYDVDKAVGSLEGAKLRREFEEIIGNKMYKEADFKMFMENKGIKMPPSIEQIKGKGNAKPKDTYLPFVQDFVQTGEWSKVEDLKNTGLIRAGIGGKLMTPAEHAKWLARGEDGMKSGGKVQFAKSLDAMRHELTKAK